MNEVRRREPPSRTHEPGYKAVLVREEAKDRLQSFRRGLPNRDLAQERHLATAALELVLNAPELHEQWVDLVRDVVRRDLGLPTPGGQE